MIKSGNTAAGAKAAASHTGSLAGSEAVYDAIFQQAGIIRVNTINELFDYASAFAYRHESNLGKFRKRIPMGNRVAIVTNAGGPGIVATDMTLVSGLRLAEFSEETIETLASHLPATANLRNPVDVIGDASQDRYENALSAVIRDEGVDGALVILNPPIHDQRPGHGRSDCQNCQAHIQACFVLFLWGSLMCRKGSSTCRKTACRSFGFRKTRPNLLVPCINIQTG